MVEIKFEGNKIDVNILTFKVFQKNNAIKQFNHEKINLLTSLNGKTQFYDRTVRACSKLSRYINFLRDLFDLSILNCMLSIFLFKNVNKSL